MAIDYQTWYDNAKAELAKVEAEKTELEQAVADRGKQIAALKQTLTAIAPLVGETPPEGENQGAGLTDSIRGILAQAEGPLTAADIRDRLSAMGFDMAAYSNPLATIHTILRRLTEADEAYVQAGRRGKSRIEPIAGKRFVIGKNIKGFIGIARLRRRGEPGGPPP